MNDKTFKHLLNDEYKKWDHIRVPVDEEWKGVYETEQLLLEFIEVRKYRVKCVPVYIKNISYNDVITFKEYSTEYTVEYGKYTCLLVKFLEKNKLELEKFSKQIIIEYLIQPDTLVIAYQNSEKNNLKELQEMLMDTKKYEYLIKGKTGLW